MENSQWFGKGAKKLGLIGKVKAKDFKKLLHGELLNGERFRTRNQERPGYKERAGLDCTFSAPKSVSIKALVEGRKELEKAHQQAVLRTLKIIERDYATTRVTKNRRVAVVNTNNLVVGQFHHDTSRELDPHLHTHCVILNMTHHNNRWYSFRNDDIHANKKLLGMVYQNELAIAVKKLGYEIEQKGNGQFEIKGFSDEQLESFSKRRQQIKSQLNPSKTWKQREKIWDRTRIAKGQPIPREELQKKWLTQLNKPNSFPQPNSYYSKQPESDLNRVVSNAIQHCSSDKRVFKPETIKEFVLNNSIGEYKYQQIEKAVAKNNQLLYQDGLLTTQHNYEPNQHEQSNPQRNSHRDSQESDPQRNSHRDNRPNQSATRQIRVEPPQFNAWARELSEGINGFTEQEEIQRLEGSFERINRYLENRLQSTRRTEAIRNSIERLDGTITEYAQQQQQQSYLAILSASALSRIANYIEQETINSSAELINGIRGLNQVLKSQFPNRFNQRISLLTDLDQLTTKQHHQQSLLAFADYVEQETINSDAQLVDSIRGLNQVLKTQSPNKVNKLILLKKDIDQLTTKQQQQLCLTAFTNYVEQETINSSTELIDSIRGLNQVLKSQSVNRVHKLVSLKKDIDQLTTKQQQQQSLLAFANYIEQETINSSAELIDSIKGLNTVLKTQSPNRVNRFLSLTADLDQLTRQQQQQLCLTAFANYVEQETLNSSAELIDGIRGLNQVLKFQSPNRVNQRISLKKGIDQYISLLQRSKVDSNQKEITTEKQLLRQEYERLNTLVRHNPNFTYAGVEEVDTALALLILKDSANRDHTDHLLNRVGKILSQSDRLLTWKQNLPQNEYKLKAEQYIIQKFSEANQIRESVKSRNQDVEFEQ